jgi:hypothetical protein
VTCPNVPPVWSCPPPARTKFTPTGGNDQPALYAAAAKGPVELVAGTYRLATSTLPSGADICGDDGAITTDYAAYTGWSHMFAISGNQNITLTGSGGPNAWLVTMPLTFAQGNIQNNCVWIGTSSNTIITGLRFDKCGEDSIYIGNGSTGTHVKNVVSTNPLRNGLSVTDKTTSTLIEYSSFNGARNLAGGIADGIDVEPNGPGQGNPIPGQFIKGLVIDHVTTNGNAGDGICFCLYFINSSTPVDAAVTNNMSNGNGKKAFNQDSWPSPMNGAVVQKGNSWN